MFWKALIAVEPGTKGVMLGGMKKHESSWFDTLENAQDFAYTINKTNLEARPHLKLYTSYVAHSNPPKLQRVGPLSKRNPLKRKCARSGFIRLNPGPLIPMAEIQHGGLVYTIRPGDRVTIVNRFGQQRSGRAVMPSSVGGWVLNMGGAHGTPALADDRNIVNVKKRRG